MTFWGSVVLNIVKEKSESKSQHLLEHRRQTFVVLNIVKEKSESKSQRRLRNRRILYVVLNIVKEKSESKSQRVADNGNEAFRCFKYCQRKI